MARLSFLVLRCADIEKSRVFFEIIGLRFVRERHGNGVEHYASEDGALSLELYPSRAGSSLAHERLGFAVESLDQTVDALARNGAVIRSPPTHTEWGPRAIVEDPDGRSIELEQDW